MPANTTSSKKGPTGQSQLPLSRVKKIISVDPDIGICSNNAAFIITIATEKFIQHLAAQAAQAVKLDRKPRKNIQYKDVASAISHHDNLEFLEDTVPKTQPYSKIKEQAAATRARLNGDTGGDTAPPSRGKKQKITVNIGMVQASGLDDDPNAQLELETQQAAGDEDVEMTG